MIDGTNLNACPSMRHIDLSDNPVKPKQASKLISFVKYMPNLNTLNIAGACSGQPFADVPLQYFLNDFLNNLFFRTWWSCSRIICS